MAVLITTWCRACDEVFPDVWSDDKPRCCGSESEWMPTPIHTTEWGSPRHIPNLRDEPFGSRSELATFTKNNGLALGASSEKIGGARNESHLNTGKIYSYAK